MPVDATEITVVPGTASAGRLSVASRVSAFSRLMDKAQVLSDRNLVLKIIAGGTLFVMIAISGVLLASYAIGNHYVLPRLVVALVLFVYVLTVTILVRRAKAWPATLMILGFYISVGLLVLSLWGLNVAVGQLILGMVIVLSGILLGARSIIPTTAIVLIGISTVQAFIAAGLIRPDTRSLGAPSNFLDLFGYAAVFVFIAIVSWLSGRRMEQSLAKALQAEAELQAEKDLLEVRLEERTRSLREVQLEEMRQLYRYAELGQLGTVVLHDLANNLTVLTLDIDDIEAQSRSSEALRRARASIKYLDNMVAGARRQLRSSDKPIVFNAVTHFDETIAGLRPKAARARVALRTENGLGRDRFTLIGDPLRFTQIVTILVTNAIEAYEGVSVSADPEVRVALALHRNTLQVTVTDTGNGFTPAQRQLLFEPFHSTKKTGMGIGLFIAREIVERHFKGSISLSKSRSETRFIVRLPEYYGT